MAAASPIYFSNMTDVSKEVHDIKEILSVIIEKFSRLTAKISDSSSLEDIAAMKSERPMSFRLSDNAVVVDASTKNEGSEEKDDDEEEDEERRIEPESGRKYTYSDFEKDFSGTYSEKDIQNYWRTSCKLAPEEERRIDPDSGQDYSWPEFEVAYEGFYTAEGLVEYWNNSCKPVEIKSGRKGSKDSAKSRTGSKDSLKSQSGGKDSPKSQTDGKDSPKSIAKCSLPEIAEDKAENLGKDADTASETVPVPDTSLPKTDALQTQVGTTIVEEKTEEVNNSGPVIPKLKQQGEFHEELPEATNHQDHTPGSEQCLSGEQREAELRRLKGQGKGSPRSGDSETGLSREEELKRLKGLAKGMGGKAQGKGKGFGMTMTMQGKGLTPYNPADGRRTSVRSVKGADGVFRASVPYEERYELERAFHEFCFPNNIPMEKVKAYTAQGVLLSGDENPIDHMDWWPLSFEYDPRRPVSFRGASLASVDSWE